MVKPGILLLGVLLVIWPLVGVYGSPQPKDHYLLRTLQHLSEPAMAARMSNLAAMGPESYKQLRKIAFDGNYSSEVRAKAFQSLVTLGQGQAQPEIEKAIDHQDWFLRTIALVAQWSLDNRKGRIAAKRLLLEDRALMVRASALERLEQETEGGTRLRDVYVTALEDPKNFHRGQSLWLRPRIAKALINLSETPGRKHFEVLLRDPDPTIRQMTLEHLRASQGSTSVENDEDQEIQKWISWVQGSASQL